MKVVARTISDDIKFEWLVTNRSKNQFSSLELYKLLERHREKIEENRRLRAFFHTLLGVNFSLWRSVFLSDLEQSGGSMLVHASEFMRELIENNSINYPQDKKYRDYTFRYYIQNARQRLMDLTKAFEHYEAAFEIPKVSKGKSPQEWWSLHQDACESAISALDAIMSQAKRPRGKKISN